jgi:glycosidase
VTPQAATPAFSVSAGTYKTLQSVAIADSTSGATIYYTTDGTAPTTASTEYAAPIPVAATTTLSALAVANGYTNSNVDSATYNINLPAAPPIAAIADIHQGFIYQIVTDRFFDGDTTNDNPSESPGLYDANGFTNPAEANWGNYWGGDLAGIQQKISYLQSMGVAGIWISPPMNNIRASAGESNGYTGYHGYWTRDFMQIDEHFGNEDEDGDGNNTWTAFDNLITAAHAAGIRVYVDFPANDTNPIGAGEDGSLYNNGALVTTYSTDTGATPYYHHNPDISNYEDRYQVQYDTLEGLADLDQTNPWVDQYLKTAIEQLLAHGVDGFRFDAAQETNWGWEYSLENTIANWSGASSPARMPGQPFIFGEWNEGSGDALYPDSVKFSNNSGINLLDYTLYWGLAQVFSSNGSGSSSFSDIDNELTLEDAGSSTIPSQAFTQPNDLVTFFDNHDNARILSQGASRMSVKEAISFLLTCRGVPVLYYGDEQYLHNDTDGGAVPYNRNGMEGQTSFGSTDATLLIQYLAALRAANPAVAWGTMKQRWINTNVYIYERQLGTNVVLVAINNNPATDQAISGLYTDLPPGNYTDYLAQTMGGTGITVTGTAGSNNPVTNFTLPHNSVSIWVSAGTVPSSIGSVTPRVANPGAAVTINGAGFGSTTGTVNFTSGSTTLPATVTNWSNGQITAVVPSLAAGAATVTVTQTVTQGSASSAAAPFTVNSSALIPVNFSVSGTPTLASTDVVMISGNVAELGDWAATWNGAVGPVTIPAAGSGLLTVSVPAGATVQFKFFILHSDGTVTWENGANHSYSIPTSGVGAVAVTWQN